MSVYFTDGDCPPSFLASNKGWGDFCRWAESLSPESAREVIHLTTYGWTDRLDDLDRELSAFLRAAADPGVKSVGKELLDLLKGSEVAVITDGTGPATTPQLRNTHAELRKPGRKAQAKSPKKKGELGGTCEPAESAPAKKVRKSPRSNSRKKGKDHA